MSIAPRTGVCISCGHDHGNGMGLLRFPPSPSPATAPLPAAPAPTEQAASEVMPSPMYFKALALAHESGRASVAQTQRVLSIGWSEAENLIDLMIQRGDVEYPMTSGLRPARPAPTVPKLDYDLLKLTLEQTQERLRQAEESIAKRDATALRVAQCAGEFARDAAWPAPTEAPKEPLSEQQVIDRMRPELLTDMGYRAMLNGEEMPVGLPWMTRLVNHFLVGKAPDSRDAARWRFMMKVADNDEGPEAAAINALGNDQMETNRPESEQMNELTDQAIAMVAAQEKAQ